jgi:hypothetical protein
MSPTGQPPDDSIVTGGTVQVVSLASGNNAARLTRTTRETVLDGTFGVGAVSGGAYCASFLVRVDTGDTPLQVEFLDGSNRPAWRLIIDAEGSRVLTPYGLVNLPAEGSEHHYRFDMDFDIGRFDVYLQGDLVQTGLAFLDATFSTPSRLRFSLIPAIVEAFPGVYVADEIAVRKTS